MIIASLSQHEDLKAIHTFIRAEHSKQLDFVNLLFIEEQVTEVLYDLKPAANSKEVTPASNSNDEVLASIYLCYYLV